MVTRYQVYVECSDLMENTQNFKKLKKEKEKICLLGRWHACVCWCGGYFKRQTDRQTSVLSKTLKNNVALHASMKIYQIDVRCVINYSRRHRVSLEGVGREAQCHLFDENTCV